MYGTDDRFTTTPALGNPRILPGSEVEHAAVLRSGAAPVRTLEGAYNDLKVKVGHYYAPVGYEVVPTTGNFFPNLPYTFQYGEPFTFTGVQATWQYTENVAIGGGIQQGWDNFDAGGNPNTGFNVTYVENFADGASLAITSVAGNEADASNVGNRPSLLADERV